MTAPAQPETRNWQLSRESWWWLAIAAVMVLAGILKNINLLLLFGYVMIGLFGLNAWLARRVIRSVTASRVPLPAGFAGQSFVRALDITNSGQRPIDLSVKEDSTIHSVAFFVPELIPGETRRVFVEFSSPARGRYRVNPLHAEAGHPFGLLTYSRDLTEADELVLLPAIGTIDRGGLRRWLIRRGAGDANSRRPVQRQSSNQSDVRGVRAYRPGDSPRDIHWRTTARRNSLMVREYDSTEPLDLVLIVEPWLPAQPTPEDHHRLESTLCLAASIFWSWCLSEDTPNVTLILASSQVDGGVRNGRGVEAYARQALELLASTIGSPGPHTIPTHSLRSRSSRCVRIIVTSHGDSQLPSELRNRSGLSFVTIGPQQSFHWYTPPAYVSSKLG